MSDDGSVTKIAANVFLLASAGWGLQIINERPLVGAAFGLYTLKGLLGAMSEVVSSDELKKANEEVNRLALRFGPPLVVADVTKGCCLPLFMVAEFFLAPGAEIVHRLLSREYDMRYIEFGHGHALGAAGACLAHGCTSEKQVIFVQAFIGAVLTEDVIPPEVTTGILALACYLTWATLKGKLPF